MMPGCHDLCSLHWLPPLAPSISIAPPRRTHHHRALAFRRTTGTQAHVRLYCLTAARGLQQRWWQRGKKDGKSKALALEAAKMAKWSANPQLAHIQSNFAASQLHTHSLARRHSPTCSHELSSGRPWISRVTKALHSSALCWFKHEIAARHAANHSSAAFHRQRAADAPRRLAVRRFSHSLSLFF